MNTIILAFAKLQYTHPIVTVTYNDYVELGFNEIRDVIRACEQLAQGKRYVLLSDARGHVSVTPLGIKTAFDPLEAPLHCGSAVLVRNPFLQAATTVYGTFQKPAFPYKAFTDEQKATAWLHKVYEEEQKKNRFPGERKTG